MAYSKITKLLHRLALSSDIRCEVMFDLEHSMYSKGIEPTDNHIFVCGMARAGTTIFMRTIYDTSDFSSLTYRDMPLLMMPNLWNKISTFGSKDIEELERAHADGIKINYDSPEALEEIFWRVFTGSLYISNDKLCQYDAPLDAIEAFREYVFLINLSRGKKRYLSKNNNNILRINTLNKAFPASYVVILFRDPLAQSASLLNQHKIFLERHRLDAFSNSYMNWLVHHEFGLNHKMFKFKIDYLEHIQSNTQTLGYWLEQWLNVYTNMIRSHSDQKQIIFLCYEDLCSKSLGEVVWENISNILNITPKKINFKSSNTNISDVGIESLARTAFDVYSKMRVLSSEQLGYTIY